MPILHIHAQNPAFYIALLALGLLTAIKSGAISPEAGIWTMRMPKNYDEILPYCPPELQSIIECFDELDALYTLDPVAYAKTIDQFIHDLHHILAEYSEQYGVNLTISGRP